MVDSKFVAQKGRKKWAFLTCQILRDCSRSYMFYTAVERLPCFCSLFFFLPVTLFQQCHICTYMQNRQDNNKIVIRNLSGSGTPSHFRIDFSLAILKIELVNNENQQTCN